MFESYDTDKSGFHEYDKMYEELLGDRRYLVDSVLELGVYRGGSLRAWRDYFPNAEIVGLDIDSQTMIRGEDRITTVTGNVRSREDLIGVASWGPFDFVVDDASHLPIDQFHALKVLWKHVKPGGFYFIEDLDLNRQGAEILTTCHLIVRETCREFHVYLGNNLPRQDDVLVLEKT